MSVCLATLTRILDFVAWPVHSVNFCALCTHYGGRYIYYESRFS